MIAKIKTTLIFIGILSFGGTPLSFADIPSPDVRLHPVSPITSTPVLPTVLPSATIPSTPSPSLMMSMEQRTVEFVRKTVMTLNYSDYQLGGTVFDMKRGVYVLDCSSYVDHILQAVYPAAYLSLVAATGSEKPTTQHYYEFFTQLSNNSKRYWNNVKEVKQLEPGDIVVFRDKKNMHGTAAKGHVMIVMNKPMREMNEFVVRVADSASVGHSQDTRLPHVSGIGIGTLLLKVNPKTGKPYAYAWKVGSPWKSNVKFAMARPVSKHAG